MGWRRKRESEKMGRAPCCDKVGLKKGPWTPEEDNILVDYINKNGHGSWRSLPQNAGLSRCGKSCRLRWTNYLRPDIKRGPFTPEEERTIIHLHAIVGNRWSTIAGQMPGRTDNEIKNFWNTHLKKRLQVAGVDPVTFSDLTPTTSSSARHMAQWESARLEAEARLSRESLLLSSSTSQPQALDLTATAAAAAATDTDHFLRMWHSEVGESFRRFCPRSSNGQDGSTCQPAKHTASPAASSSSTAAAAAATATASTITSEQCGSGSVGHNEMEKKGVKAVVVKREESRTSSNEMEAEEEEDDNNDSQETSLSLLLDFPASDEMDFFQGHLSLSF